MDDNPKSHYFSLKEIEEEIRNGNAAKMIEELEEKIKRTEEKQRKSILYSFLALCYLHLEALRKAFQKCAESIKYYPNQGLAYYLQGVTYLWTDNEEKAIETWSTGIPTITDFQQSTTLKNLVFDHNFREYVYKHKFDVLTIISIFHDYEGIKKYSDSDIEVAYSELKNNSLLIIY